MADTCITAYLFYEAWSSAEVSGFGLGSTKILQRQLLRLQTGSEESNTVLGQLAQET